ncbi:hypothetical protein [Bacillus cereus]|uniref:hypothetical protein n=1 Tax=Bacillus cereus TaxID=1396 RepID=UPI003980C882
MSELIKDYLNKVDKIQGIYTLRVDENVTYEMMSELIKAWEGMGMKEPLLILPFAFDMKFQKQYSFYLAMMLVGTNNKVTRHKWVRENIASRQGVPYLEMRNKEMMKCLSGTEEKLDKNYTITHEDMQAEDWMIAQYTRENVAWS